MARNYRLYEQAKRLEGRKKRDLFRALRRMVKRALAGLGTESRKILTAIQCMLLKTSYQMSYRSLAAHLANNNSDRKTCGLKYCPSKSALHAMSACLAEATGQNPDFLEQIVRITAGSDAYGDQVGDSTGMAMSRYVGWHNTKYGDGSRRDFVKLHILAAPGGKITVFAVTSGTAHDSPAFAGMCKHLPYGHGFIALDAAYDSEANCQRIVDLGRVPVIRPRGNSVPRGSGPRANMIRWHRGDNASFMVAYGKRNYAESVFASMKERFGGMVRAKKPAAQKIELFAQVMCYNMTV